MKSNSNPTSFRLQYLLRELNLALRESSLEYDHPSVIESASFLLCAEPSIPEMRSTSKIDLFV